MADVTPPDGRNGDLKVIFLGGAERSFPNVTGFRVGASGASSELVFSDADGMSWVILVSALAGFGFKEHP